MNPDPLYSSRAYLYDRLHLTKNYAAESRRVRAILEGEGITGRKKMLDAACGTGGHLVHLAHCFEASGFDQSSEMLAIAREKLPGLHLFEADLRSFEVAERVDVLLCLFNSIGYLPIAELPRALSAFARAVVPGGVLLIEPWYTPDVTIPSDAIMVTHTDAEVKLCLQAVTELIGDMTLHVIHGLVARSGFGIEYFVGRQEVYLCAHERMRVLLDEAGFDARFDPEGITPKSKFGVWIARRRG